MEIDNTLLDKLERLAMIEVQDREKVRGNLNEILGFVENLNGINTDNISLDYDVKTPLREDSVIDSSVADSVLKNAPNQDDRFFIVPKIIE